MAAAVSPTKQLEDAITRDSLDNVKKAIDARANIKAKYGSTNGNSSDESLFLIAVGKGNKDIIKLFLDKGYMSPNQEEIDKAKKLAGFLTNKEEIINLLDKRLKIEEQNSVERRAAAEARKEKFKKIFGPNYNRVVYTPPLPRPKKGGRRTIKRKTKRTKRYSRRR